MKIYGLVGEFNPFHNGHKFLIEKIKKEDNPDLIISIISSSFVQRGEPAILSKWDRCEIGLEQGIDLIVELPFIFACQNAEIFSKGAIKILDSLNIDTLFFGTENGDIADFLKIANAFLKENDKIQSIIKEDLNKGKSFINARNNAYLRTGILNEEDLEFLSKGNNILGIEYTKTILENNYNINISPVLRKGPKHNSYEVFDNLTSATNIRNLYREGIDFSKFVPEITRKKLYNEKDFINSSLISIIKYDLLDNQKHLMNTMDYEKGIENRIISFFDKTNSFYELADLSSTKRITTSRIKRMIINSLIRVKKEEVFSALKDEPYIRILGFNKKGQDYLSSLNNFKITNFKEHRKGSLNIKKIAMIENKATNLFSILRNESLNLDYKKNPIII